MVRRLPVGAEHQGDGRTHVRVWAPASADVYVVVEDEATQLQADGDGYFSGLVAARPGTRYRFRLDGAERLYPDPASRFQPDGPHGASEVVDPSTFVWSDDGWRGPNRDDQVLYELHIGTFTSEGTWQAATNQLPELAALGVTTIEVMPIAEFDGRFGWGYDGVDLYAPFHGYGRPDDLRRFVDRAHALGLAVILDVVYNHFGPSGNYLRAFSPSYFSTTYENEWGDPINFDGADAGPVREFFEANAGYWIAEYHFDGLRLDATQQIFDASPEHILTVVGRRARQAAGTRSVVLVAENEPQDTRLVRPETSGGYGLDALWNDDFHHSAMVALTGRREAYYSDTTGTPQEFVSAAKYGYLFQGQYYHWQHQPRGTPSWGLPASAFVAYLQNHDQVANSAFGLRGHQLTSPGRWRAMTALLLLQPSSPMLFQGQEFSASTPFLYFADFDADLAAGVRKGRGEFLTQFTSIRELIAVRELDDPGAVETFERCVLDPGERERHGEATALHRDVLRLRREDTVFRAAGRTGVDGAVLTPAAFVLRYFSADHADDRLIFVNLGHDIVSNSFAEPLIAPPTGCEWILRWSSEDPSYGGGGMPDLGLHTGLHLPGESTVVLAPVQPAGERPRAPVRRRTA